MNKMNAIAIVAILTLVGSASAALFTEDFEAGNLDNWTTTGTWETTTEPGGNTYARGLYNESDGTIAHSIGATLTEDWSISFSHEFEYGSSHPFKLLSCDMLDDSGNGYRVRMLEGNFGDPGTWGDSMLIFKMTAGSESGGALTSGNGFNQDGWLTRGLSAPDWRNVNFSWEKSTGLVSASANGNTISIADSSYSSFTTIRFVGDFDGTEVINLDNITLDSTVVPEPSTTSLLLMGAGGLMMVMKAKRASSK